MGRLPTRRGGFVDRRALFAEARRCLRLVGLDHLDPAARWFKGESLEPVIYLPKHLITKADVDQYMPAQW